MASVPNESYLVIGGGGFVGQAIVKMLLDEGAKSVSVFDLRRTTTDPRTTSFITGDITSKEQVSAAVAGKTVVIHTAAVIENMPKHVYWAVNVDGTKNVIDACVEHGVPKLVYTSSASVTYNGQDLKNGTEEDPYCEVHMDTYNETKAAAEQLVLQANGKHGLRTVSIRPAGVFGPADNNSSKGLFDAARKGNWKFIIGDNTSLFDWTYVDNVAYAHILAAKQLGVREGVDGQAFFITNDEPVFFWDIPKFMFNEWDYTNTLQFCIPKSVGLVLGSVIDGFVRLLAPYKKLNPTFTRFRVKIITSNRYLDISKAKDVLGYKPVVPLEEGLKRAAAYWAKVGQAEG
ncbi:3-beta hydroxysteroid dehydrogenase/isomerase family-domain-containing protein [Gaertneriomyces semiglobifer]|nr:3-beta hydroxysteroid dehydrogenase/isomerase family-domain-containing protein [Gaertneriomyces semiglobifer]